MLRKETEPVVALQRQMAPMSDLANRASGPKFGFGHALVEIVAVQDVIKILDAIDVVLAFLRGDQEADVVPLADRLGGVKSFALSWDRWSG